jgi:hypothetical protein
MKNSINNQLNELYFAYWSSFSKQLDAIVDSNDFNLKPTNPLLLKHCDPSSYENADIKIMIIGQETNDWEGIFYNDMGKIQSVYEDFYTGHYYAYRGYFRNHFNKFIRLLENKFPNKNLSCFWNNVIKIGCANEKGTPPTYIMDIEQKFFPVLEKEIEIIKPNVILFFSGYTYDQYIIERISDVKTNNLGSFQFEDLQQFKIKNVDYAFRTSHPQRLHFSGKVKYEAIYDKIISEIKF